MRTRDLYIGAFRRAPIRILLLIPWLILFISGQVGKIMMKKFHKSSYDSILLPIDRRKSRDC